MAGMKTLSSLLALAIVTAGCSGGGTDSGGSASETGGATLSEAAAPADSNAPPPADDVATLDGVAYASLTGDAASGKTAFMQCRTCHVVDPGMNRVGPSLANIVGRKAGTIPGFNYSKANADSGITWTEEKLFQFLEKPQRVLPKSRMIYAGMPDAQKRADLIAYLKNPG